MKKFLIKVNGSQYEVEVEEISNAEAPSFAIDSEIRQTAVATSETPAQAQPRTTKAAPAENRQQSNGSVGSVKITAPMPGTILKIVANVGDAVKRGSVILILEAMKMENEIVAPSDGIIASINVSRGASVNAGDLLASLN